MKIYNINFAALYNTVKIHNAELLISASSAEEAERKLDELSKRLQLAILSKNIVVS